MPDEYVDSGATQAFPPVDICDTCGNRIELGSWPWCPHQQTRPSSPFPAFDHEGERISDLGQIRRIERETMARYQAGEKVQPLIWRDFSQDRSNRDVNAFGRPSYPGTQKRSNIKLKRREGE